MKSLGTVNIVTNRCLLRRFEYRDILNVFNNYSSNKNVSKYLTNEPHKGVYETEYMIGDFIRNYNNLNYYNWVIVDKYNNDVIGTISLHEIDLYNDKGEIGIIISPKYQNKGYAKEVIQTIINFAFFELEINRLEYKALKDNISSNKLASKVGLIFEGVIHSIVKKNNEYLDVNLYYLIK